MKNKSKNSVKTFVILICIAIALGGFWYVGDVFNLIPKPVYYGEDFGIEAVKSSIDFNKNGIDDYTDLLLGARLDAKNHPKYDGAYFDGGFPPDNIGVCTDVVWRAFKNAGYNLREMVHNDILARRNAYSRVDTPDKNIDFRRVGNLRVFFEQHAISLTTDTSEISKWQAGDIVIFEDDRHIGIVSDKRTKEGKPYIIHNGGQPNREEDYLKRGNVTGHYRFDANKVPSETLVAWE